MRQAAAPVVDSGFMSQGAVLYRFRFNLSDVDRSVYETLDFRLAQHASESVPFLLTRAFAYALNFQDGLAFSLKGLAEPEEPCLSKDSDRGGKELWIEVGNPSGRRLHKAAKASSLVKVYTYKNPELVVKEIVTEQVHNGSKIEVFALAPEFLAELEAAMDRDNEWEVFRDQGSLMVTVGGETFQGDLRGPLFAPGK